ncbi:DUF5944 family protein [Lysinibacillus xylanilyticus]|uniref:DUF5944 family protein n=1 Tax=Lysinibacillus xylanilyticus TaxID=582475 RepID=UPI003816C793
MKIVHKLKNTDFQNDKSLKNIFEKTSLSRFEFNIQNKLIVEKISSNLVKVKANIQVDTKRANPLFKIVVYFPEKKYAIEFIKQAANFDIEFLYEILVEKEYFNLVIFDRNEDVVSSATYIFNSENIIPYPLMEKDISNFNGDSTLYTENQNLVFETKTNQDSNEVNHVWQNLGQFHSFHPKKVVNGNTILYQSALSVEKMCSGIWMLIATDAKGKLITQYTISVS